MEIPPILYAILGLLVALQIRNLFALMGLSKKIRQLSEGSQPADPRASRREENARSNSSQDTVGDDERSKEEGGQLFAEFLAEDPSRTELSKKEQFEAFRRWRSAKGLNWRAH